MICPRTRRRSWELVLAVVSVSLLAGCARSSTPTDSLRAAALIKDTVVHHRLVGDYGPTVFTDTALFRRVCMEADSGLTARTSGKCTPRDQGLRLQLRDVRPREP